MPTDTIKINVPILTRVEGEGALDLTIENQKITDLKLRIYEPPRYFEKFLEGRKYYDVPDTVARICGICPVAYQMSASHAIESIFDVEITPWVRAMRRLFYCGEWLQSHSLHIHLLAAPDFLGFNNAIEMSAKYGDEVRRGLKLQALGNDLIALFGARSVHPVGVKVGGFSKAPSQKNVDALLQRVTEAKQDAVDLIHWLDTLDLPEDNQDFISVALHHDAEYPFNEGRIISDHGLDIPIDKFEKHFREMHVDHSTALHCLLDGKPYLVGPLARLNLNADQLPDDVKAVTHNLKTQFPSKNMFHSIIARAIEIYFTLIEAEQLLVDYEYSDEPCMSFTPKKGTGYGCTEAPRGFLWHRYDMDKHGCVEKAVIVPPTSQNQPRIEQDLQNSLIRFGLESPKSELQLHAEKVIRNYDPCISCATHFLDLNLIRDGVAEKSIQKDTTASFKNTDLSRTVIIGIGSPNQGDELGWQVIDKLQKNEQIRDLKEKGLSLLKLDRPGILLGESIKDYDHVLIVDAIKPNAADKSFVCINGNKLTSIPNQLSSHETGVIESIALLESLQLMPKQLVAVGVSDSGHGVIERIKDMFL
ncbi:MAG: hydrogenase maturation protease [Gammaproteobacteria bacterium]|nr:hydrogenase maturation protease [Gammaproteobacteria bacterium]